MTTSVLSFYTIVNDDDSNPTESLLYEEIEGDLQHYNSTPRIINGRLTNETIIYFMFYPDKFLSSLEEGMKVVDNNDVEYRLEYYENFDDEHQEIRLTRKN